MTEKSIQRLAIAGELSIFTCGALRERLLAALSEADQVEVSLDEVSEMDTAGVQLMIAAKREALLQQKVLSFTGHSPIVLATLDLCDLVAALGDPVLLHSRA